MNHSCPGEIPPNLREYGGLFRPSPIGFRCSAPTSGRHDLAASAFPRQRPKSGRVRSLRRVTEAAARDHVYDPKHRLIHSWEMNAQAWHRPGSSTREQKQQGNCASDPRRADRLKDNRHRRIAHDGGGGVSKSVPAEEPRSRHRPSSRRRRDRWENQSA